MKHALTDKDDQRIVEEVKARAQKASREPSPFQKRAAIEAARLYFLEGWPLLEAVGMATFLHFEEYLVPSDERAPWDF